MLTRERRARCCWMLVCAFCLCSETIAQSEIEILRRARELAWTKQFRAAETMYLDILSRSANSRDAAFGLAQVILWQGRYSEARRLFIDLAGRNPADVESAEGAATAAYWQGDYRTAAREFSVIATAHPERQLPRRSLAEIASASRGGIRGVAEGVDDDQPYRAWRSSVIFSSFSDPLTRWDITSGVYHVDSPNLAVRRTEPFFVGTNETVLPWQRLTITTSVGALRWPDGVVRPIGSFALSRRLGSHASVTIVADHRELLTASTSVATHAAVTHVAAQWSRYAEQSWMAGIDVGHNRYYDQNSGGYAQAYALWPLLRRGRTTIWAGASAATRDTRDIRFDLDAMSSTRSSAGDFLYSYRGGYRPYWTPRNFREGRAIVSMALTIGKQTELKAQAEAGVGRDEARAFGPARGIEPLPSRVFTIDFDRTFHPYRLSSGVALPLSAAYRLEFGLERNVTAFYAANAFRASLVRYR